MQRLETPRLALREMRPADVESLHRLFSDPLLMRFWPVFFASADRGVGRGHSALLRPGRLRTLGRHLHGQ